jgi:hypothetical protein
MKSMLIAAVSLGAVIAGIILYAQKTTSGTKLLSSSDGVSDKQLSNRAQHAMG